MDVTMQVMRRLELLPDEKLMQLLHAVKESREAEAEERQTARRDRLAVIDRELRARGIFGPPWWSSPKR